MSDGTPIFSAFETGDGRWSIQRSDRPGEEAWETTSGLRLERWTRQQADAIAWSMVLAYEAGERARAKAIRNLLRN